MSGVDSATKLFATLRRQYCPVYCSRARSNECLIDRSEGCRRNGDRCVRRIMRDRVALVPFFEKMRGQRVPGGTLGTVGEDDRAGRYATDAIIFLTVIVSSPNVVVARWPDNCALGRK
jgi:hypothetical protein